MPKAPTDGEKEDIRRSERRRDLVAEHIPWWTSGCEFSKDGSWLQVKKGRVGGSSKEETGNGLKHKAGGLRPYV